MSVWSSLGRSYGINLLKNGRFPFFQQCMNISRSQTLKSEERILPYAPSRWQWNKFKDALHFYALLGAIPCGLVIFYCNVFIGPAQLQHIPEGYEPKHWEYHRHPITRFIARYIYNDPQMEYEKTLHFIWEESQKQQLLRLESEIKKKMAERQDYQAYYYRPAVAKYLRLQKKYADETANRLGERGSVD